MHDEIGTFLLISCVFHRFQPGVCWWSKYTAERDGVCVWESVCVCVCVCVCERERNILAEVFYSKIMKYLPCFLSCAVRSRYFSH